ncbi:MAG: enterobactin exporter EntS [Planctomycetes bacterium ADurb.Bin401]|nr:MAG: enterobactin exporter EntS [Planctomycetes bacterium ADurb.Bin401]
MVTNSNGTQTSSIKVALRALKHRNYRLFFAGQGISLIGTWMQQLALGWLVYRLTSSAFYLGVVPFCNQLPVFLGAPVAGVFADHWSKRKILITTQICSMALALTLAGLIYFERIELMWIIIFSISIGVVNSFDIPTRQAFVYEMVDNQEDLPNAIALNSLIFNIARLIGPSLAGFLIAFTGSEKICFLINGVSYLAVILSLIGMNISHKPIVQPVREVLKGFKDGANYAFGFMPIRTILFFTALISIFAVPYVILMPVFAKDILHGDSSTLGLLTGCIGLGAFVGAIFLAMQKNARKFGEIVIFAACVFAVGLIGFSFSRALWLSLILIVFPGFGLMVQSASTNIILQTIVDDDKRGRVMSFHVMAFVGTAPFGNLLAGFAAERIGAPNTMFLCGILSIAVMSYFIFQIPRIRQLVHPIYVRKGIIPEVAEGLHNAAQVTAQTKE